MMGRFMKNLPVEASIVGLLIVIAILVYCFVIKK